MPLVVVFVVALLAGAALWYFQVIPLLWYWSGIPADTTRGLGLSGYRVMLEAHPIAGVETNASALSYNDETGTLFTTTNAPPQIVELSREGETLRQIPVAGLKYLEGIAHMQGRLFILVDERQQRIYRVALEPDTARVDVTDTPWFALDVPHKKNRGLEGVTWDEARKRLFVAKEKTPRVFEIDRLPRLMEGRGANPRVAEWRPQPPFRRFLRDLSSLSRDKKTGHMLLLSDESQMLAEYDAKDELVGLMPLWRGFHGLTANVPQAEGVAVGRDGVIYLVSEPNLFYRFEHPDAAKRTDGAESSAGPAGTIRG